MYNKSKNQCNRGSKCSKFQLEVLEYCDSAKAVLISKEQHYLDISRPNYNILKTAGSTLFKHTEETLAKLKLRKFSKGSLEKLRLHLSNLNLALNIKNVLKLIYTILVQV